MNDLRKAAEMALEALQHANDVCLYERCEEDFYTDDINALRQALAQPEQEPVAWHEPGAFGNVTTHKQWALENGWQPLYTTPPKREWVGLTDEEVIKCFDSVAFGQVEDDLIINKHVNIFRAIHGIEAKLKEKNA